MGLPRRLRDTSEWETPGVYFVSLTLGGRVVTVKLLVREHDSGIHVRYLYTTDLSLSGEEACRVGDRVPPRDVKALGLVLLEDGRPKITSLKINLYY